MSKCIVFLLILIAYCNYQISSLDDYLLIELDSEEGNDPWKGKIELVIVLYFLTMATCA
jgi:hypothetical protein